MAQTAIGKSDRLAQLLNEQVANCMVLYMKLHNYHWFVKGEAFFTLHAKFEELYNMMAANLDELAERLLTLGGRPAGNLRECLEISKIREAAGTETTQQMVATLQQDFETVIAQLKDGIAEAEELGDQATADMLLGMQAALEKENWFLRAFLA